MEDISVSLVSKTLGRRLRGYGIFWGEGAAETRAAPAGERPYGSRERRASCLDFATPRASFRAESQMERNETFD